MKNVISKICIILSVFFVLFGFVSPIIISFVTIDNLKLNEITDWLTGSMSTCFSLSSIFLVISTINNSYDSDKRNNFQNKFFRMFDIFCSIKNRMPDKFFETLSYKLDEKLIKIDYTLLASDSLRDIDYDTCEAYDGILQENKNILKEYMDFLYEMMMFVNNYDIDNSEKKFCMKFLSASISNIEKKIIFYHTLNNSSGKRFHDIIEKYNILWNLDTKQIVHSDIVIDYYGKKIFR